MDLVLSTIQTTIAAITLVVLLVTNYKINRVEYHTNSMKDELVREVRDAAYAAGRKAEQEDVH